LFEIKKNVFAKNEKFKASAAAEETKNDLKGAERGKDDINKRFTRHFSNTAFRPQT